MKKQEYILCASICDPSERDAGNQPLIYCGLRHHNILWQGSHVSRNLNHQGFLTNTGRHVNRNEGMEIAFLAGQISERKNLLYSEDLY